MPYYRITEMPTTGGIDVTHLMAPPPGTDIDKINVQRMMEATGIPHLTVATATELYRRTLILEYGKYDSSDLPEIIGKHLGLKMNIPELSRTAFHQKAKRYLWINAQNHASHMIRDIVFTDK